ncbi:mucin-17-like isoform X2 [Hydractinia symbiolongicarpus]|uniref:mucin-17-like isoform X2 n=1 Tax=Hydractinia symbiolongicarpus TaxID=13093 RepID=UPI00254E2601|nr:mucin-17-like isoform X2 [Hydractinia symbiolongicarpus]
MDELRSWFEVPAIAHFFHIFRGSFDLTDFEIEDFEETLFLDNADNVSSFLPDLVIRLLRGMYRTKDGLQVTTLKTRTKVEVLFNICNWRLELHDAMELTKDLEADDMRVTPVGRDSEGNTYWYFYGVRLYKEAFSVKTQDAEGEDGEVTNKTKKKPPKKVSKKRRSKHTTKSGRSVRKRKRFNYSSQESADESEKSVEITDDDTEDVKPDVKPIKLNLCSNAWSLECSTLSNWDQLLEKLSATKNKTEKELLKNLQHLREDVKRITDEREKAYQKKLLAMAPRRVSERITVKMQQIEKEQRILEQERLLKNQLKAKEAEERQKQLEVEREKEREKRYKERERIQEERALRVKLRETQKLVADHPELAEEIKAVQVGKKRRLENREDSNDDDEDEEDQYKIMERIMEVLKKDDDAWPFLEPVNEEDAPNYYSLIETPMDFQKISEKIEKKEYKDKHEFEEDVMLVFDNCEMYNGTYSSYTKLAFEVKKIFEKLMKREFPPDVEIDDDDFFEVDQPTPKPTKFKKPKLITTPSNISSTNLSTPSTPITHKNTSMSDSITPEFARAQMLQAQARMRQLHQSASLLQSTNIRHIKPPIAMSPRFALSSGAIAKMTPAQMQSLLLKYPKSDFAPSLAKGIKVAGQQHALAQKVVTFNSTPINTTTLNPLQQLANTALSPAPRAVNTGTSTPVPAPRTVSISRLPLRFSSPNTVVKTVSKTMSPGQVLAQFPHKLQLPTASSGRDKLGGSRGRPKKIIVPIASMTQGGLQQASYVSGLSATGVPVTVKWEDLKLQLMSQMKNDVTNKNLQQVRLTPTLPSNSTMPGLRPVSGTPVVLSRIANTVTTAGLSGLKTFSFSNVLKPKEFPSARNALIIKKSTAVPSSKSVITSPLKAASPIGSTLANTSGMSKVQEWLKSSGPYIAKNVSPQSNVLPINHNTANIVATSSLGAVGIANRGLVCTTSSSSLSTAMKLTPVLKLQREIDDVVVTKPATAPIPTINKNVATNLTTNILSVRQDGCADSNMLELQKAAIQAAAVNQISAKLQTHLNDKKQAMPSSPLKINSQTHGIVISPVKMVTQKTTSGLKPRVNNAAFTKIPKGSSTTYLREGGLVTHNEFHGAVITSPSSAASHVQLVVNPSLCSLPTASSSLVQQIKLHTSSNMNSSTPLAFPKSVPVTPPNVVPVAALSTPLSHQLQLSQMILSNAPTIPQTNTSQPIQLVQIPDAGGLVTPYVKPSANQVIIQQPLNNQGQIIRYVIPAQGAVGTSMLNLNQSTANVSMNQVGAVQNIILKNSSNNGVTTGAVIRQPGIANLVQKNLPTVQITNTVVPKGQILHRAKTLQVVPNLPQAYANVISISQPHSNVVTISQPRSNITLISQPRANVVLPSQVPSNPTAFFLNSNQLQKSPLNSGKIQTPISNSVQSQTTILNPVNIKTPASSFVKIANGTPHKPNGVPVTSSTNSTPVSIVQTPLVMNPSQLQKLTDEGRIVVTPSGQFLMIPSKGITKIPASIPK